MIYFLILLACYFASPLKAEIIGNVEYHLPRSKQEWKVVNELHGKKNKSVTVIYGPDQTENDHVQEFFSVHSNLFPTEKIDQATLKKSLQPLFPDQKIRVAILEKDFTSVLYEWSAGEKQNRTYGITRVFPDNKGTVILGYQTESPNYMENSRTVWMKALKEAKLMK